MMGFDKIYMMNIGVVMQYMSNLKRIFSFIVERMKKTYEHDTKNSYYFIVVAFFIGLAIAITTAIGSPTGIATITQILHILFAVTVHIIIYCLFIMVIPFIFSLLFIPIPRVAVAATLYAGILFAIVLHEASSGLYFSIIIGILTSILTIITSLIFHLLFHLRYGKIFSVLFIIVVFFSIHFISGWQPIPTSKEVNDDSPASLGNYDTTFFTYGSGSDIQRQAFADDVAFKTTSLDASHFITKWSDERQEFWDFGPENFPMNGRVWMPEGEGPFPIVLMVHGNHSMEYLSTGGYDYLGELLASRGFFFVSVDEDFVNYSNISGQPNNNYELRAWILLQHLAQLQDMNMDEDHLLYNKLDFQNIALGGHSRGGQAAAMAADYMQFYDDEIELVNQLSSMNIQAVIAVSPTDKLIDNDAAQLYNTSYLTLHGSHDTDVYSFRGDFQFYRTTLEPETDHMRSTVYIENANHVHFNTDWDDLDLSYPRGMFLNQFDLLQAKDQQEIAKVYISAFLEKTLHQNDEYTPLFEQEADTANWLPETNIISKFRPATYRTLHSYYELPRSETYFDHDVDIEKFQPVKRSGKNYTNQSLKISFEKEAFHKMTFQASDLWNARKEQANKVIFTVANASPQTAIDMTLTIRKNGENVRTVEHSLSPVIEIDATIFGLFDEIFREGKYEQKWEPIFENIDLSLDDIGLHAEDEIELLVQFRGESGNVLLEEIGVY